MPNHKYAIYLYSHRHRQNRDIIGTLTDVTKILMFFQIQSPTKVVLSLNSVAERLFRTLYAIIPVKTPS